MLSTCAGTLVCRTPRVSVIMTQNSRLPTTACTTESHRNTPEHRNEPVCVWYGSSAAGRGSLRRGRPAACLRETDIAVRSFDVIDALATSAQRTRGSTRLARELEQGRITNLLRWYLSASCLTLLVDSFPVQRSCRCGGGAGRRRCVVAVASAGSRRAEWTRCRIGDATQTTSGATRSSA